MAKKPVIVTEDAPIPNKVDPDAIKEKLGGDHFVSKFSELGQVLLEQTNRPNVVTLEQFTPFIPLFNTDVKRYETDREYKLHINRLYNSYVKGLGINLYEPTIIIASREDPKEIGFLDRAFTRIKSDNIEGESNRNLVPSVVSKASNVTRDDLILEASLSDIGKANTTAEQKEFFTKIKIMSAFLHNRFVENHLSEDKRKELMSDESEISPVGVQTSSGIAFELDDD